MYSKIYDIDFPKLANLLTPPFLRKERLITWMGALLKPLEEVNLLFKKFRGNSIYKVTHNGQTYSLQATLNDAYDNELRRIRIKDSFFIEPLYIYPDADERPVYINPDGVDPVTYVYDDSIFDEIDVDFIVCIPVEYRPTNPEDENILLIQIRSLIDYYKLASKRYKIVWI